MSDIRSMLKDLEMVMEHSESDLHKLAKKEEYTPQELECIKDIAKIAYYHTVLSGMTEGEDEGYSGRHPYYDSYTMNDGMSRNSYARRRRDSMGRYSGGYSYNGDEYRGIVKSKLEEAMHNANDREREAIEQYLNRM